MQLTRFTDYGLRILLHFGSTGLNDRRSLASLSDMYNMNHHHVNKVSQKMAALGWIQSSRGKSGGITVEQHVMELSLAEIVRELEANLMPIDCKGLECPLAGNCKLQGVLGEALQAFLAVLGKYHLKDVIDSDLQILKLLGSEISPE
ncbi:MAG: RrF2 family transcriptional regulator [Oceanobacter sp.]